MPPNSGPTKRPFEVGGERADGSRVPAIGPAVDRDRGAPDLVRVVDVASRVAGQGQFLAPSRQPPQVPLRAREGALRVLALDADDIEAVALDLQRAAEHVLLAEAGVDRGKRDRDLLLPVVGAQPFERPAGDRDVAVGADALGVDDVSQPVIVGDVVAAGEGLVARDPERGSDAPQRVELRLAVRLEIAADALAGRGDVGVDAFDRSVGQEAADLECPPAVELPVLRLDRREDAGIDMGRQRQVAVRPDLPMVGLGDFEALPARNAEVRREPAGRALLAARDGEDRQQRNAHPEELQMPADEAHLARRRIVDDPGGGDCPAWPLRAPARRRHGAWRVNGVLERGDIVRSGAVGGGEAGAVFENHEEIVDGAVAQRVGQFDIVANELVLLRREHDDIALRMHLPRLAVPDDLVGGHVIAVAAHPHFARRRDDVRIAVVSHLIGAEVDDLVLRCRRGRRCGRRRLRLGARGGGHRHQHRKR